MTLVKKINNNWFKDNGVPILFGESSLVDTIRELNPNPLFVDGIRVWNVDSFLERLENTSTESVLERIRTTQDQIRLAQLRTQDQINDLRIQDTASWRMGTTNEWEGWAEPIRYNVETPMHYNSTIGVGRYEYPMRSTRRTVYNIELTEDSFQSFDRGVYTIVYNNDVNSHKITIFKNGIEIYTCFYNPTEQANQLYVDPNLTLTVAGNHVRLEVEEIITSITNSEGTMTYNSDELARMNRMGIHPVESGSIDVSEGLEGLERYEERRLAEFQEEMDNLIERAEAAQNIVTEELQGLREEIEDSSLHTLPATENDDPIYQEFLNYINNGR